MRECATSLQAEMTPNEAHALTTFLRDSTLPQGLHLEIGTAAGGTLCNMMLAYPEETRPQFVVIDPMTYFANQYELVRQNVKEHGLDPDKIDFRRGKSHLLFQTARLNQEKYSFILIDGNHKLKYVTRDLCWSRLLVKGGVLCLHDYNSSTDIPLAVDKFLAKHSNYEKMEVVDSLIFIRKLDYARTPEVSFNDLLSATIRGQIKHMSARIAKRIQ